MSELPDPDAVYDMRLFDELPRAVRDVINLHGMSTEELETIWLVCQRVPAEAVVNHLQRTLATEDTLP